MNAHAQTAGERLLRLSEQLAQAEQLRQRRQFDKAESLCSAVLRQYPDCFGALYTLGLIHADRKDSAKALGHLFRALMQAPRSHFAALSLTGVLVESGALDLATTIGDVALSLAPEDPAVLVTIGELRRRKNDHGGACDAFRRALERDPAFTEAAVGLAHALFSTGEAREGAALLERMIAAGHASVDALFVLSQAPDAFITRDLASDVDRFIAGAGPLDVEALATLAFVKAGAWRRAGRHELAWAAARDANKKIFALRSKEEKLLAARQAESLDAIQRLGRAPTLEDSCRPVSLFILGPSRSGKTTLERLVATAPGVRLHYERPIIAEAMRWTCQSAALVEAFPVAALPPGLNRAFAEKYFALLREVSTEAAAHSFTNPEAIHEVAFLAGRIPNVRIVCMKRDLNDNALRIALSHYQSANAYAYDLDATFAYLDRYHRLIDALAAAAPEIVRIVSYEEMVAAPGDTLRQVAGFAGLAVPDAESVAIGDDRGCAEPYLGFLTQDRRR